MLYAIVAVIALIADQAVKYWTSAHIVLNSGRHELIPGFIHLANVHNTGAAFSFMEGARWLFVALCAVFIGAVIYLMVKDIIRGKAARWLAVLVMAGAAGNCIDRIISGYVVDMFEFDFKIFGQQFPVFNVADILITVCGIAFCVFMLLEKPADEAEKQARRAAAAAGGAQGIKPRRAAEPEGKVTPFPGRGVSTADDPFAEWEQMTSAKKSADIPGATSKSSAPRHTAGHGKSTLDEPKSHVRPASAPEARRSAPEVRTRAPEPAPAPEARPDAKPQTRTDETSFDLDDILAEFRDL
ncbi:MAG: signal peptidase II [Butyricicoccus sp.]|nr:signal peptidase II [Butyricicoccus sp.]